MNAEKRGGKARGSRRLSRELCLRALYQWQLTGDDYARLLTQLESEEEFAKANVGLLKALLEGVLKESASLDASLAPHMDREVGQLSPVEHAALLIGAYELTHSLDVPYKVAINESVELTKRYGGTDGHKFVNGVLDKMAKVARRVEIEAERG